MGGKHSAERKAVAAAYSGQAWKDKVNLMSDGQVFAVYSRLKAQGKVK